MRRPHLPKFHKLSKEQLLQVLDVVKFIILAVLLVAFINFNEKLSKAVQGENGLLVQIASLSQQNKALAQQNKALSEQIKSGNDSIHGQINCVLELTPPNPNVQPCIISFPSSSGGATGATKSGSVNETPAQPQPTTNNAGTAPTVPAQPQPAKPTPKPKPVTVLGKPACVPFINLCVTNNKGVKL